jgi:hypothetical protein
LDANNKCLAAAPVTSGPNSPSGGPVDCVGSWGACSTTCGTGTQIYNVTTPAANGGTACTNNQGDVRRCSGPACGQNCVGDWIKDSTTDTNGWGACSATCGSGTQTRTYHITTPQVGSGSTCPHPDGYQENQQCPNLPTCSGPVNCEGSWSWSGCSASCGGGTQTGTYTVTKAASNGGTACPNKTGDTKTQACNTTDCCSLLTYTDWQDVPGASVLCQGGALGGYPYQLQERSLVFPPGAPSGYGPTSAPCAHSPLLRGRPTAAGCPAVAPTGGACDPSSITYSVANGCPAPASVDPTSGTCASGYQFFSSNPLVAGASGGGWNGPGCYSYECLGCSNYGGYNKYTKDNTKLTNYSCPTGYTASNNTCVAPAGRITSLSCPPCYSQAGDGSNQCVPNQATCPAAPTV